MSERKFKELPKQKKEYVVALTGYRYVAHVRPGVRPIRFRTLFVNKSYRRYTVCCTTSVVEYVRQTIVNSHPALLTCTGSQTSSGFSPIVDMSFTGSYRDPKTQATSFIREPDVI